MHPHTAATVVPESTQSHDTATTVVHESTQSRDTAVTVVPESTHAQLRRRHSSVLYMYIILRCWLFIGTAILYFCYSDAIET